MIKKAFRVILVLGMIFGIAFSISNFFFKKAEAVMTEELLHYYQIPGGWAFWCTPDGQGCYTVEPPQ
jgi:hypothetical protein